MGALQNYGWDLTKLRGLAGSVRGTAALITAEYPLALYLHCASHCLNLAVHGEVTPSYNMMGVVDRVSVFFAAHPKCLEKAIADTQLGSAVSLLHQVDPAHLCFSAFEPLYCSLHLQPRLMNTMVGGSIQWRRCVMQLVWIHPCQGCVRQTHGSNVPAEPHLM